jgi:SAM-dependent methyltransferase
MKLSRDKAHFERIYATSDDPWHFRSSAYEREKYAATLAALPARRFSSGLEVGCSIGELTALLAPFCDSLLGIDIVAEPLAAARLRCAAMPHVRFSQLCAPAAWPDGRFDLVMLSEVLYFLSSSDINRLAGRVCQTLAPGGVVLLVNWLGQTDDPETGHSAAQTFIAAATPHLHQDMHQTHPTYRIDRLLRPSQSPLMRLQPRAHHRNRPRP